MNDMDKELLSVISEDFTRENAAYNIRKDGESIERNSTEDTIIESKSDNPGINVYVKDNTEMSYVHIPVLVTKGGFSDKVYNDFYIGKNSNVIINAGCGIHNDAHKDSSHNGIHRFFIEENSTVKYIEKHYGEGMGDGAKILDPVTEVHLAKNSTLEMETAQIRGVSSSIRTTNAFLKENAKLVINEKILTQFDQKAKTIFKVVLEEDNSSAKITSRSVAEDSSHQDFISEVNGNSNCFAHVECDAIIKDDATVASDPKIVANNPDARLIHEASIGKIAGEQLTKLMTLGLTKEQAEETIINGFLK